MENKWPRKSIINNNEIAKKMKEICGNDRNDK